MVDQRTALFGIIILKPTVSIVTRVYDNMFPVPSRTKLESEMSLKAQLKLAY